MPNFLSLLSSTSRRSTAAVFLLATIGCQEHKITAFNSTPEASISNPSPTSKIIENVEFDLIGQVSDDDEAPETLITTWRIGTRDACTDVTPSADGMTTCKLVMTQDDYERESLEDDFGEAKISLTVRDSRNASATVHAVAYAQPNKPPEVQILKPTVDSDGTPQRFYADQNIQLEGTVVDPEDPDGSDIRLSWESSIDGVLPVDIAVELNEADDRIEARSETTLSQGDHILTLKAIDLGDAQGSDQVAIEVIGPNEQPECNITIPTNEAVFNEDDRVSFAGTSSDSNDVGDFSVLSVQWSSDRNGVFNTDSPSPEGLMEFDTYELFPGDHVIALLVTDDGGLSCEDTITMSIRANPTIEETEPADGSIYTQGETVALAARVYDTETPLNELYVSWESLTDGYLGSVSADPFGHASFEINDLSAGTHVITVTVIDTDGMTGSTAQTLIINQPPTAPTVSLSPIPSTTTDDLHATIDIESIDPEGEPISYSFQWYIGGELSLVSTTDVLPSSATRKGDTWSIRVVPSDGETAGPSGSASVDIQNTPPSISGVTITPAEPLSTDTLTCSTTGGEDMDADPITLTTVWWVDGVETGSGSETLGPSEFSPGSFVSCSVTPSDDETTGDTLTADAVRVNVPPVIHSVSVTPDDPSVEDDLTCVVGLTTDGDGDTVTTYIRWFINDIDVGESSSTLVSTGFAKDDAVHCSVTPSDGHEDGETVTATPVTILNTPPSISAVTITPTDPLSTDTLTCSTTGAEDIDADPITLTTVWWVDGIETGSGGETLDPSEFSPGSFVSCSVTPSDDETTGETLTADAVRVNVPPIVHSVSVTPDDPTVEDDLTCVVGLITDGDGDTVTTSIRWFINDIDVGESSSTLDSTWFAKDDAVHCSVTPSDGHEDGETVIATPVTVQNAWPEVDSLIVTPTTATTFTILTAVASGSDADFDTLTFSYNWTVNGSPIAGTGDTLNGSLHFDRDDTIGLSVIATDGLADSTPMFADTITVANTPPTAPTVTITPTEAAAAVDDLVCAMDTGGTDDDLDPVTYSFNWTRDGEPFTATVDTHEPGDTIPGHITDAGEIWTCHVTPNDGTDDGPSGTATVMPDWRFSGWGDDPYPLVDADVHLLGTNNLAEAGTSVSTAGDIDGDGMQDILVGAPQDDTTATNAGRAYLVLSSHFVGSDTALLSDAHRTYQGSEESGRLGYAVAGGVDLGGSAEPDVIIGAYSEDMLEPDDGTIGVFWDGGPASPTTLTMADADVLLHGGTDRELAGYALATLDDMDDDGLPELLIGAPHNDSGGSRSGVAYLVLGSSLSSGGTIDLDGERQYQGESGLDQAGDQVRSAGDVDGDGITDLLIAAPYNEAGGAKSGRVYVVYGADALTYPSLILGDADIRIHGEAPHDYAGLGLSNGRDVDGDGSPEVIFGAPANDDAEDQSGRAYLFWGSGLGSSETKVASEADVIFSSTEEDGELGFSVSAGTDVDADGMFDVIIGVPASHEGGTDAGAALLFLGEYLSAGGVFSPSDADYLFYGTGSSDHAGYVVLGMGDIDGDGFGDLAVSEPDDTTVYGANSGSVHLLFAP